MRRTGFVIFAAGLIISSWFAARYVPTDTITGSGAGGAVTAMDRIEAWGGVAGWPFAAGALLMMAGGVIARRGMAREAHAHATAAEGTPDTHALLVEIDSAVAALPEGDVEANAEALRHQLDDLLDEKMPAFADARQRHELAIGAAGYAELSSAFASAERNLSRAWSALTDEAWAEVPSCIAAARQAMTQALELAERHRI